MDDRKFSTRTALSNVLNGGVAALAMEGEARQGERQRKILLRLCERVVNQEGGTD